jgi:dynactin-4
MLYCNYCRWDSMEVGIKFDKPTGLAGEVTRMIHPSRSSHTRVTILAQLQKDEDGAVDTVEFDALKDHFESILRAAATAQASHGSSSSTLHATSHHMHAHKSSITAAASAALARDIPGVAKYNPTRSARGAGAREKSTGDEDEVPTYNTRLKCADGKENWGGDADVERMRHIETIGEVATLEQRWSSSWTMSLRTECVPHPSFFAIID